MCIRDRDKAIATVNGDDMGREHQFLERPFDTKKEKGTEFIGDYRARLMAHGGSERPQSLYTSTTYVGNAEYNLKDQKEHGLKQRIRFGVDARINDNTNVKVLASASGTHSIDTANTTINSKGLNKQRLENLDVTHSGGHWDFSIGRLSESMGATGYWFNKTFDGVRAVWTDQRSQFRTGIGSFKASTGITDSSYNHSTYATYFRAPTLDEFIGLNSQLYNTFNEGMYGNEWKTPIEEKDGKRVPQKGSFMERYLKEFKGKNENLFFVEQLSDIENTMSNLSEEERAAKRTEIVQRMAEIVGKAYPELTKSTYLAYRTEKPGKVINIMYEVEDANGTKAYLMAQMDSYSSGLKFTPYTINKNEPEATKTVKKEKNEILKELYGKSLESVNSKFAASLGDPTLLTKEYIDKNKPKLEEGYKAAAEWAARRQWIEDNEYSLDSRDEKIKEFDTYALTDDGYYKKISSSAPEAKKLDNPIKEYKFKRVVKIFEKGDYVSGKGSKMNDVDVAETLKSANFTTTTSDYTEGKMQFFPELYLRELIKVLKDSEQGNTLPRAALEKVIGKPIKVTGLKLERDTIPAIDRAIFAQFKTQVNPRLGLQAWFLRSLNNNAHSMQAGHVKTKMVTHTGITGYNTDWAGDINPDDPIYGDVTSEVPDFINDTYTSKRLANIFAIGAQYQVGDNALISLDYGFNRSDFGRYMNGHTNFDHVRNTADFTVKGHSMGGTPHFWTARLDLGQSDYTRPGSWNAFVDYKYFAHGSFFGGNGTGAVPDRYLDGIRSFTLGGGYVPRKDLLLEAFYTFDAKGIGQRDTLYGGENFKLGNYTRIQGTYKF